jgi:hypothetical protein
MAMIGRNAAIAEMGPHRHEVEGPVAFAAWLGVHAMLLTGTRNKIDAFMAWGWDYFSKDRATRWLIARTPRASSGEMTTTENNLSSRRIPTEHTHPEPPQSPARGEDRRRRSP